MMEKLLRSAIEKQNINQIRQIAKSTGFLDDKLRAESWRLLMASKKDEIELVDVEELPAHRDEDQIKLDINRSFVYYPVLEDDAEKQALRDNLQSIIVRFFRSNPSLSYYQGLHDICTIFLLIFKSEKEAYKYFEYFALNHLRDFMMPNISSSVEILHLIPELLVRFDKSFEILVDLPPFYCLSPVITLFSHDVKHWDAICLVFDQVLATGSIQIIVYLYVALLLHKQKEIDVEEDVDILHNSLSKILQDVEFHDIKLNLPKLYKNFTLLPLSKLKSWRDLNEFSVLRTKIHEPAEIQCSIIPSQLNWATKQNKVFLEFIDSKLIWKFTIAIGVVGILLNVILSLKENSIL